jgi:hypothetical protein
LRSRLAGGGLSPHPNLPLRWRSSV